MNALGSGWGPGTSGESLFSAIEEVGGGGQLGGAGLGELALWLYKSWQAICFSRGPRPAPSFCAKLPGRGRIGPTQPACLWRQGHLRFTVSQSGAGLTLLCPPLLLGSPSLASASRQELKPGRLCHNCDVGREVSCPGSQPELRAQPSFGVRDALRARCS